MSQKMYHVVSPDGFPITAQPFASVEEAQRNIPVWCARFKKQGYYSTASREKISLKELPHCLQIVPAENFPAFPHCC